MFRLDPSKDEFTVSDPKEQPTDTVSSISWSKTSTVPTFATGSWDSHVRIYQVDPLKDNLARNACFEAGSPCLGVDWHSDGTQVFAGCASGDVKGFNLTNSQGFDIGRHDKPVKDVHWVADLNVLCSVSFDKTVKLWDLRQSEPVYQCELRYKPISSDLHGSKLALALDENQASVIDLAEALKTKNSQEGIRYTEISGGSFRDHLTMIKFFPDGERIAFGTVAGRDHVWKLERDRLQAFNLSFVWTFYVHRVDGNCNKLGMNYPVNSILVNSKKPQAFLGTCAGGGERKVYYLDFYKQRKTCEFEVKDSVTCGKMSWDGDFVAFATGYDWSRGISEYMTKRSEIYVRRVYEKELGKMNKK